MGTSSPTASTRAGPTACARLYVIGGVMFGLMVAFGSAALMGWLGMQPGAGIIAGILSGVIVVLFGWFMPSRTVQGTRQLEKVLGFREFLSRVEGDRLDRMVKTPEMFEKFLPFRDGAGGRGDLGEGVRGDLQGSAILVHRPRRHAHISAKAPVLPAASASCPRKRHRSWPRRRAAVADRDSVGAAPAAAASAAAAVEASDTRSAFGRSNCVRAS